MKRFRGGLVFKAHRLLYHSTLGLIVIKKKRREEEEEDPCPDLLEAAMADEAFLAEEEEVLLEEEEEDLLPLSATISSQLSSNVPPFSLDATPNREPARCAPARCCAQPRAGATVPTGTAYRTVLLARLTLSSQSPSSKDTPAGDIDYKTSLTTYQDPLRGCGGN